MMRVAFPLLVTDPLKPVPLLIDVAAARGE